MNSLQEKYAEALDSGKVVVRRWWVNTQSDKDQVSVQFQQQIEKGGDNNDLIAIAQGGSNSQRVTAIHSFKTSVARAHLGSTEGSFVEDGQPVFGNDMFGQEVNIQVIENFVPNPKSRSHEPKCNPSTGEVVMAYNPETKQDDPVYRHTELISGTPNNMFISKNQNAINAVFGKVPASIDLKSIVGR